MKIYFARHCSTSSNIAHRVMGARVDEPLSNVGEEQARQFADQLDLDFTVLFASPMRRAVQTAEYIRDKLKLVINVDSRLIERDMGTLSGHTWPEIEAMTSGALSYARLKEEKELDYSAYGGENIALVRSRIAGFLNHVKAQYGDQKVLVVTHGGIIRCMYNHFSQASYPPDLHNASLHEFII